MGTRLYPTTKNLEILERLANVPTGTAQRYETIRQENRDVMADIHSAFLAAQAAGADNLHALYNEYQDLQEKEDNLIWNDAELSRYHHFAIFGWGNLTPDAQIHVINLGMDMNFGMWDQDSVRQLHRTSFWRRLCSVDTDLRLGMKEILRKMKITLPKGIKAEDLEGLCWN